MRNRAKCRLCNKVIESCHRADYVMCACGEIAINGGDHSFMTYAKNYENFLRVDDNGNEIIVTVEEREHRELSGEPKSITKQDLVKMLEEQYQKIDSLPAEASGSFVTHADLASVLMVLVSIFRSDCALSN